jgi:uncharacterized membrane protein YphA (DoxX/SURF4 family)
LALVAIGFRFALAAVFLLAGLAKLPRRRDFVAVVRAYELLPSRWVSPVAGAIPMLELGLAAALSAGAATRWVAMLVVIVLVVFSAAVGVNLARGRQLDCGCFAVGAPRRLTWLLVARNAVLAAMASVVFVADARVFGVDEVVRRGSGPGVADGDAVALLLAAVMAVVAVTAGGELLRLLERRNAFDQLVRGVQA